MRVARLGTILLLLLPACAGIEGSAADDAGGASGADGGVGFADGGGAPIDAGPPPLGDERSGVGGGVCYDGFDNDDDGFGDCADDGCTMDAVCCVGSAACCTPGTPVRLMIPAACSDTAVSDCVGLDPALVPFGTVGPDFESGGLVPQGGASYGGVALGPALDPRGLNVALSAQIEVPATRCDDCIDAAGIGFFEAIPDPGERAAVQVGVLVNGGRDQVQVLVADRPVQTYPLEPGTLSVSIELTIEGRATIRGIPGAADLALDGIELPEALTPVVFGRTDDVAGVSSVSVRDATATSSHCDVPAALRRRADPLLPASSTTWTPTGLGRIAIVDVGTPDAHRPRVLFAHEGELLAAGPNGVGELIGSSGPPDVMITPPVGFETLHDPWLVRDADRVIAFFAGARSTDGKRQLLRANGSIVFDAFGAPTDVSLPEDAESVDGPTVWIDDASRWRMIARVDQGDGPRLVALISDDDGESFDWVNGRLEASIVRAPIPDDVFAIDRDEVGEPALVRVGGTWRLYYAARRGQRWSIGLLVSEEGLAWRAMDAVLMGDGAGFDALGVRSPAPLPWDGDDLRLYYVGTDGSREAVGLAGPAGTLGE